MTVITIYWYANGIRVVQGKHEEFRSPDELEHVVAKTFPSLESAQRELSPSNRAQSTLRFMLEQMK